MIIIIIINSSRYGLIITACNECLLFLHLIITGPLGHYNEFGFINATESVTLRNLRVSVAYMKND